MKKILKILLNIAIYASLVTIGYYIPNSEDIYVLVNEKLVPILAGVLGAIISLFSLLKPLIMKLDLGSENIKKSIEDNNNVLKENSLFKEKLGSALDDINKLNKEIDDLVEIVKLGFGNNPELVKNGVASKIYKIGEDDEK